MRRRAEYTQNFNSTKNCSSSRTKQTEELQVQEDRMHEELNSVTKVCDSSKAQFMTNCMCSRTHYTRNWIFTQIYNSAVPSSHKPHVQEDCMHTEIQLLEKLSSSNAKQTERPQVQDD